ncbi:MAG: glycoside hydrolase family protein [Patescibacteria group bacterium]|nr:glycoside hydrolase family protein [Patescibacteria group bacterium]
MYSVQKAAAIAIVIVGIFIPILLFVIMLGVVKSHFERVCNWRVALDVVLTGKTQEAFDLACKLGQGGDTGGGGAGGSYGCAGSSLDTSALKQQLQSDEGLRLYPYKDTNKKCTIGYGHNLEGGSNSSFTSATNMDPADFISKCCPDAKAQCSGAPTITQDQADAIFSSDLSSLQASAASIVGQDTYDSLPGSAKQILVEMRFQLGEAGLRKFKDMIAALQASPPNFPEAANQIRDSRLYDQTTSRAENQATRMENVKCEKAVIPSVGPNNSCYLEENCKEVGTYGNNYKICQAVVDKLLLVPIDTSLINVTDPPRYITYNMAEALKKASQACGKCFSIQSAYRNCEHQKNLYQDYLNGGTIAAKPGESNHNGGQGVDIYGSGDYECNMAHCSKKLVGFLFNYALIHFNGCNTPSGDFYTGSDCVHFSNNGR